MNATAIVVKRIRKGIRRFKIKKEHIFIHPKGKKIKSRTQMEENKIFFSEGMTGVKNATKPAN
jgi:hypothetical protein